MCKPNVIRINANRAVLQNAAGQVFCIHGESEQVDRQVDEFVKLGTIDGKPPISNSESSEKFVVNIAR